MNLGNFPDRAAEKYPHKDAVVCGADGITYQGLKSRSETLASALYSLGLKKGSKAGILSSNCIEYIEIIFALLKLGVVCVPLNYRLSAQEIKALTEHAGIELLFYAGELDEKVPLTTKSIKNFITIGSAGGNRGIAFESFFSGPGVDQPSEKICEDDESFIIYTAGTTGNPKGVVLTHGNQIWNTINYTAAYGMSSNDKELAPTPLFHASTLGRVFTYVFNCVTFVLCKSFNPGQCLDIIQQQKVTSITQAPTMYRLMLNAFRKAPRDTGSVIRAVTGAAPMTPKAKKDLRELFPKAAFFDLYGLTEAGPGVTILNPADFSRKISSVGRPMQSVEVQVQDEQGKMVPAGQVGEIFCRGPNIMKGYYKDPGATAQALHDGWLRTGDMGKMDGEGYLYLVGRKKEIIISGGVNIFPGEVEEVLNRHPSVEEASVIGATDETWGETLVAVVVLKQNKTCTAKSITDFCRQNLAAFKCPRAVFFSDGLPRNAAQKVVKSRLQRLYSKESENKRGC